MTTTSGRAADARRSRRSGGQWLIGVLLVLAVAASVLMIFTTDDMPITAALAVVAALWAGVIAAILVTKYRRQADSSEAKARDLRLVYELQLEREITARRQYEMGVESQVRKEVRAEANEELSALKAEVKSLRSAVEVLLGGELPEERTAIGREKLRELHAGDGAAQFVDLAEDKIDDGAVAERDFASTPAPGSAGQHSADHSASGQPTEVFPIIEPDVADAEHVSAETEPEAEIIDTEAVEEAEPASQAGPEAGGRHGTPLSKRSGPYQDDTPTDEWATPDRVNGIPAGLLDDEPEPPAPQQEPAAATGGRHGASAPAAEPVADEAGAHASGRSVAELLNEMQNVIPGAGGRRRRRD